ncbi:MAG: hypothetical protein GWO07_03670 [Candidatus Dadabacteria bacterium]|nr:hypothetical protein [Candidatus Dadabacteria bacterium]NIS07863.1 hypothetical protein [Candidatus Dadabacteria bacterium]NIV42835.1 hypothetical protein [Candidatus Dadabacteria bacterium]NIY21651.1 hypothetical protein [Candidatus Dadabacteria bacterium]
MNKFKYLFQVFIALLVLSISGCDGLFESKPQDVLIEYLNADTMGDHKKAYSHISSENKKNKPYELYAAEKSKYSYSELAKLFIENTTHKIENVEVSGDTAKIRVDTTTVNMEFITREIANAGFRAATTGKTFIDIQKDLAEKYKTQKLPLHNYKSNHKLIKEKDGWKVVLNY